MGGGSMMSEAAGFTPIAIYEYLVKARAKLWDWVRPLTMEQDPKEVTFGKKTIRDTIVEIPVAEWLYGMRLVGESIPSREEQPFVKYYQTGFGLLESAWRELADRTRRILREERDWSRPLEYIVRPPNRPAVRISATAGGLATQMICHEVHHRAQVMAMLRQFGIAAENLDYTAFMVTRTELPG
jgi:uncharacterized damage-inducible protein DinB